MSLFDSALHCKSNTTPEEYYRRTVFIPYLDRLLQQLNEGFRENTESKNSPNQRYLNTTDLIYQVRPLSVRKFSYGNKTGITRKYSNNAFEYS